MQTVSYEIPGRRNWLRRYRAPLLTVVVIGLSLALCWLVWRNSPFLRARYRLSSLEYREIQHLRDSLTAEEVGELVVANPKIGLLIVELRAFRDADMLLIADRAEHGAVRTEGTQTANLLRRWFDMRGYSEWRGTEMHAARRRAFRGLFQSAGSTSERRAILLEFLRSEGVVLDPQLSARLDRGDQELNAVLEEEWVHTQGFIGDTAQKPAP